MRNAAILEFGCDQDDSCKQTLSTNYSASRLVLSSDQFLQACHCHPLLCFNNMTGHNHFAILSFNLTIFLILMFWANLDTSCMDHQRPQDARSSDVLGTFLFLCHLAQKSPCETWRGFP